MTDRRELKLQPRHEETRDKRPSRITNFHLPEIKTHFEENLTSLKRHFDTANTLIASQKNEEAKDIWRTQIVFVESALDYFIHELTKYGMNKIFNREWSLTEKFKNFSVKLSEVLEVIQNPEDTKLFTEIVNNAIKFETFMDFSSIISQLNLLGISSKAVADKAFYVQGSTNNTLDQLKEHLNRIYNRRNDIAHQSDRNHDDATQHDIGQEYVEQEVKYIEKIVNAIYDCADEKG